MEVDRRKVPKDQLVKQITDRDGADCFICKKPFVNEKPTIDHWIPRTAGGTWDVENLRLAHKKCNAAKGDLIPNPDGTIPKRVKSNFRARKVQKREVLSSLCHKCDNGRKLQEYERCHSCGSNPGPYDAPHYLKRPSPQCDHDIYWCWACCIGIVERKSAIMSLMIG